MVKKIIPHKKYLWVGGGVYIMENSDTDTDYQKVVRVGDQILGDQHGEIVEITIRIISFLWRLVFTILYAGNFLVLPERKLPPPKVPIPTHLKSL